MNEPLARSLFSRRRSGTHSPLPALSLFPSFLPRATIEDLSSTCPGLFSPHFLVERSRSRTQSSNYFSSCSPSSLNYPLYDHPSDVSLTRVPFSERTTSVLLKPLPTNRNFSGFCEIIGSQNCAPLSVGENQHCVSTFAPLDYISSSFRPSSPLSPFFLPSFARNNDSKFFSSLPSYLRTALLPRGWRDPFSPLLPRSLSSSPSSFASANDDFIISGSPPIERIRNLAIIAHVDHGKTTLMDRLLRHCGEGVLGERVMDSNALERERGITIASKYTSMRLKEGYMLNVVDTPGHADFGGEVERVLSLVDGCLLLVDACEGPLAQTKFVLEKALREKKREREKGGEEGGLRPIVVLNKMDKREISQTLLQETESKIFDLFASLNASEEQLDFPIIYASARNGWASDTWPLPDHPNFEGGMQPLVDAILKHVPPPEGEMETPFQMLVTLMDKDPFLGRLLTGRIIGGRVREGERVRGIRRREAGEKEGGGASESQVEDEIIEEGKILRILKRVGGSQQLLPFTSNSSSSPSFASVGDIVSIAGLSKTRVGDTIAEKTISLALPCVPIDPPTVRMLFSVNDSPLAGRDGSMLTSTKIFDRLWSESESNVSLQVRRDKEREGVEVQGRGELQLGILIENMRREGFELSVSPPTVMLREEKGKKLEPLEEVVIDVSDAYAGAVIESLSLRKGELKDMSQFSTLSSSSDVREGGETGRRGEKREGEAGGLTRLTFHCPSRGLIGFKSALSSLTRGNALMHSSFLGYFPWKGLLERVRKGSLVSMANGTVTAYALVGLESRGVLFVSPGVETYDGHIIGEHSREEDLEVNPVRAKQLTNVRAASKDENVTLTPPRVISLEEAIGYVAADELIEVTPRIIRLRKQQLKSSLRKSARREGAKK